MSILRLSHLACATLVAASCLPAHAQSSVSVYGIADMSVGRTQAPGAEAVSGVDSGKLSTSFWGIGGQEDLGGGLSAVFKFEQFVRVNTGAVGRFDGDAAFARTSSVGLSSKDLGTLTFGRNSTPLFVSTLMFNAFADSFGYSPSIRHYFSSNTVTGDTGWNNSVMYASPSFGGLRFGAIAALKTGDAETDGRNVGVNVSYGTGPFAASLVVQDVKKDSVAAAVDDTRTTQLGASYDLGTAKLFAQLGTVDNKTTDVSYDIAGLGVRVPVGAGAAIAQWSRIAPDTNANRNTISVGYVHSLSKRTDLYAVAMHDKIDGVGSGKSYSLGIRHKF